MFRSVRTDIGLLEDVSDLDMEFTLEKQADTEWQILQAIWIPAND